MFSQFFPKDFVFHSQQLPQPPQELHCKLGCHLRLLPMRWNWSPQKPPKLRSEEGSYLKTEKFVEVLFQKSYEIIAYMHKKSIKHSGLHTNEPNALWTAPHGILRVTSLLPPHWFVVSFAHEMWAIWGPGDNILILQCYKMGLCKDILGSYTYVGAVSAQAHSPFSAQDEVL